MLPDSIVLGTRNQKKREELLRLLGPHGVTVRTLAEFPQARDVLEDGQTFAENARKKAREYAVQLQAWVLGEDSGLVVDSLDGRPGIYSARFAGPHASDEENNERLLQALTGIDAEHRQAYYVCHVSLACPRGEIHIDTESTCHGRIGLAPVGQHGFGYDPLFEVAEYHRTFGELGPAVKSAISHRGRAMREFVRRLVLMTGWRGDGGPAQKPDGPRA